MAQRPSLEDARMPEREPARAWIARLFRTIDKQDTEGFCGFLADDAVFIFANSAPVAGAAAVRAGVDGFFKAVRALRHDIVDVWTFGDKVICRGAVTYTRHDGSALTVPFANVFGMRDDRVAHYQIYADVSALWK